MAIKEGSLVIIASSHEQFSILSKGDTILRELSTDVAELRLQNAYQIAEGAALGAILKSIDAANFQLIDGKNSKDAWDNANESLTAYHQCIELAADRLYASFTSGMTAKDVVDSMAAYFSLLGLEKDEFNDILNSHITLSGAVTRSAIATAYRTEQQRRDTANMVRESGLAARAGRPSSKGSQKRPDRDHVTCSHCGKAHLVKDCFQLHPEKMPKWMKERNEEQRKAREAKRKTGEKAAKATTHDSSPEGEEAAHVANAPPSPSSSSNITDTQWNTDTGFQQMKLSMHLERGLLTLFQPVVGGIKLCPVLFSHVLYVPDINNNLFAVIPLAQKRDVIDIGAQDAA
ncbi:hypothetical protein M407DRAFT_34303 [Tulasnella calospora MUT 4182]|uniref:Uncharacterized protein n=1 Tax=Tulasnella calospora MUT 4182 TaxID=1051891 RepID=A0A0C3L2V0_9AGAM|nr:hypothetical protein M407DRAFT_34303 [Tulasnella calospora MUT 4182]